MPSEQVQGSWLGAAKRWLRGSKRHEVQQEQQKQFQTELDAYIESVTAFNASQANTAMLESIRAYNHLVVDAFNKIKPLKGASILDVGASPHGYAMERCFSLQTARYVGIGLDIEAAEDIRIGDSEGRLLYMNAQDLAFEDQTFDMVMSMSTFEHIADVPKALAEIHRVLRPGGTCLLSFEPLWTCAYGHHLHHFGEVSNLLPAWAHLLWDRDRMRAELRDKWPENAPITLDDAIEWTYDSVAINRIGIAQMRQHFHDCPMRVEWIIPMMHEVDQPDMLVAAQARTGLPAEDLNTKGLTLLLHRDA